MAQRYQLPDGRIVEALPTGGYQVVSSPVTGGDPTKPLAIRQKMIDVQKGQAELQLTPYQLEKQKAEAKSAEIKARQDQEAYDSAHPKGTTSTVLGPASLKSLSPPDQEIVKALADGRLAFPAGFALKAPWWQQKLEQVAAYDPSFDATNYNNRAKARAMLLTGKVGTSANALNTAIGHVGHLSEQISGTASHSFTPANAIINAYEQMTGDPGITNFKDTAQKLADELESVYRNGGGAEQGVIRQLRSLDPNLSLAQKRGVISNALELLASKQAANLYQYNIGSGGKPEVDLLDPAARAVLDQFPDIRDKYFGSNPQPLSPAAATILTQHGGTPPPAPPGSSAPATSGPPTIGGSGVPHADYSNMTGGPQSGLATGATRSVYDPQTSAGMDALIRHGKPYEEAAAYAQSRGFPTPDPQEYAAAVAYHRQNPGYKGSFAEANKDVPTTALQRFAASPTAAGIAGAVGAGTAGLADVAGRTIAGPAWDANRTALAETNPGADLAGNIAGGAAGMMAGGNILDSLLRAGVKGGAARNLIAWTLRNPMKSAALGDAAYGATYGASENPDNALAGAAEGAFAAPIASAGGQYLAKGAAKVIGGVTDPAVQRLRALGIPLTVGEVLGGGAKKAQDALTSVWGPGQMVERRYADARRALNEAGYNQAGAVIGAPINDVGQSAVNKLDTATGAAFDKALNPVSLDLNTPQAIGDIRSALQQGSSIPNVDQASELATGSLKNYIGNAAPNGVMSGRDFQQAYRGLSRTANQAGDRIYGHEIGQVLGKGKEALVTALEQQNPGAYEGFRSANSAYRMLNILAKAQNAAKNQVTNGGEALFTPEQLGQAATQNAVKYGSPIAAAGGNRPFNQLINDSQQVMSSKLPTSGTAERRMITALATGGALGATGGAGYAADGGEGAVEGAGIPLALLTALGSRRGQQLLTAALIKRTAADQAAARALNRNVGFGGDALTAATVPFLTGP